MYCRNCGADEPEIKINDKIYCSSCGLPLGEATEGQGGNVSEEQPEESTVELSHAFNKLSSAIKTEEGGGSYRSKDIRINPKSIDSIRTIPRPVQEAAIREISGQESKPIPEPMEANQENTDIPTNEQIISPNGTLPNIDTATEVSNNRAQEDPLPEPISVQSENLTNEISQITPDIKELAEEVEDLAKKTLREDKEKLKVSFNEPQVKTEMLEDEETATAETAEDPVETLGEVTKEVRENKEPQLEKAVKKVDELGAASRLIDILEDDVKREDIEEKKDKNRSLGKSFSKLIDILNQPVSSPPPVKVPEKKINPITKTFESLDGTKELESPLVKPELTEKIRDNRNNGIDKDSEIPAGIAAPELEVKETSKSLRRKIKKEKIIKKSKPEKNWPIFNDEPQNIPNAPIEEINLQEPVDIELEEIEKKIKQRFTEDQESKENKPKLTKKELEDIQKEIHALGDKKGHVDHWPEEEVAHFEVVKPDNHSPLAGFLKSVYEGEKNPKEDQKKEKKKINTSRRNHLNIILFFAFLILTLVTLLFYLNFTSKNPVAIEQTEVTLPFESKTPSYIPLNYEMLPAQSSLNNSVLITYRHLANSENTITLQEQKSEELDSTLKEQAEEKSKEFLIDNTAGISYFILDEKEIIWQNSGIKYTLIKQSDLSIEDLKKMAKSIE